MISPPKNQLLHPRPLLFLVSIFILTTTTPSNSATTSFVYGGCSQLKYPQGSPFDLNVASLLTSFVNSAQFTPYNNFTIQGTTTSSSSYDTVYGLFQCRGDLSTSACSHCITQAVAQLGGTLCPYSTGGTLQLEGCLVKYDNVAFLGVEDKVAVVKRCGAAAEVSSGTAVGRRDAVLGFLAAGDGTYKAYRVGDSGDFHAVAQCVEDLSYGECQDCLATAVGEVKMECGSARWGDMYLGKCYVRYSEGGGLRSAGSKGKLPFHHHRGRWSFLAFGFNYLLFSFWV